MAEQFSLSFLFQMIDRISSPLNKVGRNLDKLGKKVSAIGTRMESAGRKMSTFVSLPISAVLGVATKRAIDFESAFTGVRKTVDASEAEFGKLYKDFLRLSKEIPVSATALMGIGEAAGQLGIKTGNIIGFTKVMANLGATTNLQGEQAAKQLARFANIVQMSQKDFDRLGSTIVDLGNNMATTEAEIADMSLRLAGAGKQIGLAESDILGMAAALSSLGLRSQQGGTAFSRVMIGMNKAVSIGGKELAIFSRVSGKTTREFSDAFKEDAVGAILDFIEGLNRMSGEGRNVSLILDELGFEGIRVADSLLRAAGAGDLVRKSMGLASNAWEENTALAKEAELRYKTNASQLKIFRNRLDQVAVTFGNVVLPALISFTNKLIPVFNWLEKLSPTTKKWIVVLGAIIAIVGPVVIMLGLMAVAIGGIATAVAFIGAPVLATLAAITAALIGVGAAIVAIVTHWDNLKAAFTDGFLDNWISGFKQIMDFTGDNPIAKGFDKRAAGGVRDLSVQSRSRTDINLRVKGEGATATVESMSKSGDAKVEVMSEGYLGSTAPAGG